MYLYDPPLGIHVQLFTPCPKQNYQKMIISSKKIVAFKNVLGWISSFVVALKKLKKNSIFYPLKIVKVKHVFYFNLDYNSPVTCHS